MIRILEVKNLETSFRIDCNCSKVIEDKPLKASELKAWGVDAGSLTGELWRPLSEDG